ncbi:hypothetical protein D3C81_1650340 [compost metagenome]
MALVIVIRQTMPQIAVQRQGIELVLQIVAVFRHRPRHRLLGIGAAVFAQPVGFVIQQVVFSLPAEYQIDKAFQHALNLLKIQRRAASRKGIVAFYQLIQLLRLQQAADRQIEL